jgi:predicted adenine nucleotide alpha hydrolase (AANH) superfamily ATPase
MEETKINYNKEFEKELKKIVLLPKKPTLLLHVCCGPCFTYPYEMIKDYFDITIIYNNSNIYPEEEYNRRLNELKWYLKERNTGIKVIEFPYDNETYNKDLEPYADQREGMDRCRICFRKRLRQGFEYAKEHNFDYFGTVMTISRYKNAQDINKIGHELEKEFAPVKWLDADFKKNDGYEHSLLLIKEHEMYFQEYCGCVYSYNAYKEKNK